MDETPKNNHSGCTVYYLLSLSGYSDCVLLLLRFLHHANYSSRTVSAAYLGLHPSLVYRVYSGVVDNVDSRLVSSTALHGLCSWVVSRTPACYLTVISGRVITPVRLWEMVYTRPVPALCSTISINCNYTPYQSAKWLPKTKKTMPYRP